MPRLIIDTIPLEVPEGTNILEAARSIGITIPHFCWHPALGKAGACRVCAVKMLEGPIKGIQMSCMLPAQNGMVVSTTDPEAMAMRKAVIEWLMINHPHDCPVCDEGGECQLQDYTIAGGHGIRRYDGLKRTHVNQYLGEQIEHEMNRCIQCYRCVRFYQEYAGGTDFGVMGRAANVYFGRQQNGQLESPFSGNLVDICPTGVFTDKTARFRARYWDYDMSPSLCPGCSLGCNTVPMARYRELLKITARRNDAVNGWFICDRGRFSHAAVNSPERPRQALVDGNPVSMDVALEALTERLEAFLALHGPGALAIVGSPRMALEGNIMAARLHKLLNSGALCFFSDAATASHALESVHALTGNNAASQNDVRQADLVALVECDLLHDAPMMALAVRQAWRNGARIYRVGGETAGQLYESRTAGSLADVPFNEAQRAVVICGPRCSEWKNMPAVIPATAKTARLLDAPNSSGCAMLAHEYGAVTFSAAIGRQQIKGIITFEADLPLTLPEGITVLGAVDWQPTELLERAEVVLPATAWIEQDGTFINYEGRAQRFTKVMNAGVPIRCDDPSKHPSREHGNVPPGGEATSSDLIIARLIQRMGYMSPEEPFQGSWRTLCNLDPESAGMLISPDTHP